MRDYIARDPRTGKPLRTGKRGRKNLDLAYKPAEGAWDSIPLDRILPLARGEIELHSVYWRDKERLMRQQDAVRLESVAAIFWKHMLRFNLLWVHSIRDYELRVWPVYRIVH